MTPQITLKGEKRICVCHSQILSKHVIQGNSIIAHGAHGARHGLNLWTVRSERAWKWSIIIQSWPLGIEFQVCLHQSCLQGTFSMIWLSLVCSHDFIIIRCIFVIAKHLQFLPGAYTCVNQKCFFKLVL